MKTVCKALAVCAVLTTAHASSPVNKVLSMLSDLQSSIVKESTAAQAQYDKFAAWCSNRAKDVGFEIQTGKADVERLKAGIAEETALISTLQTKIEELAADIAKDEADLQAASSIRAKEAADFAAEEKEIMASIDVLGRATAVLEREMRSGASMLQLQRAGSLAQALTVMIQASLIGTSDASRLTALVQESHSAKNSDEDESQGAPAATVYESHSGSIVDTLEDLGEKAQGQLSDTRKQEVSARHNFAMLKQSLEDAIKVANKDMDEAKKDLAHSSEKKSDLTSSLDVAAADLADDIKSQAGLGRTCADRAEAFQAEKASRSEELKTLEQAEAVLREATSEVQVSLVQLSSRSEVNGYKVVRFVRNLARRQHSTMLAQFASRIAAAVESSSGGPFTKVKGLISDLIARLEKDADADATEKAFCDKELADSSEKKADKVDEISTVSNRIDQMTAKSAQLKEEVATLESELSSLAKAQADIDTMRHQEKDAFVAEKAELERNLEGVQMAIKILQDYYAADGKAHDTKDGAAGGIVGLLETIEADLSRQLAEITAEEETAVTAHEEMTKSNEIERVAKEKDVQYKVHSSKELDQASAELSSDRSGVQAELDAVQEYLSKMQTRCAAKPDTYEARTARRAAEIAGLKEALEILESETAFLQKRGVHSRLTVRGFMGPA